MILATGEALTEILGGGMVIMVPPFSYKYDVVGVENWEGSSLTLDFKKMKGQTA